MALAASTIALIGVGIAGVGAVQAQEARGEAREAAGVQARELQQQGAERRKQFEAQQRIADIRNARERAEFVRRGIVARASIVNLAAQTGTSGATGPAGGVAAVQTQAAAGLGGFEATVGAQADIFASQEREAASVVRAGVAGASLTKAQVDISAGQAIQSLGGDIFTGAEGYKTLFGVK